MPGSITDFDDKEWYDVLKKFGGGKKMSNDRYGSHVVTEYDNYPIPPYDETSSEEEKVRLKSEAKKELSDTIDRILAETTGK